MLNNMIIFSTFPYIQLNSGEYVNFLETVYIENFFWEKIFCIEKSAVAEDNSRGFPGGSFYLKQVVGL